MDNIKKAIKSIKDFPTKGIMFRDLTPILLKPKVLNECVNKLIHYAKKHQFDVIVAPEARGFWFAVPLAYKLRKPFIPARKPNKLPRTTISENFTLEYAKNVIQIHKEDIKPHSRVLLIDDVLATGGTIKALINLLKQINCKVVATIVIAEIKNLGGRKELLKTTPLYSLIEL